MKTSKAFFALWNLIMLKKMISETKKERYISLLALGEKNNELKKNKNSPFVVYILTFFSLLML